MSIITSAAKAWLAALTVMLVLLMPFVLFIWLVTFAQTSPGSADGTNQENTPVIEAGNASSAHTDSKNSGDINKKEKEALKWYEDVNSKPFRMLVRVATLSAAASLGAFGAALSLMLRIRKPPANLNVPTTLEVFAIMFIGASFALIFCLLFIGGFVSGTLFPDMSRDPHWFQVIYSLQDFAKLLIWCFLAGFSERIVPHYLSTLLTRFQTETTTNESQRSPDEVNRNP